MVREVSYVGMQVDPRTKKKLAVFQIPEGEDEPSVRLAVEVLGVYQKQEDRLPLDVLVAARVIIAHSNPTGWEAVDPKYPHGLDDPRHLFRKEYAEPIRGTLRGQQGNLWCVTPEGSSSDVLVLQADITPLDVGAADSEAPI